MRIFSISLNFVKLSSEIYQTLASHLRAAVAVLGWKKKQMSSQSPPRDRALLLRCDPVTRKSIENWLRQSECIAALFKAERAGQAAGQPESFSRALSLSQRTNEIWQGTHNMIKCRRFFKLDFFCRKFADGSCHASPAPNLFLDLPIYVLHIVSASNYYPYRANI